jgi:hypothetical protein
MKDLFFGSQFTRFFTQKESHHYLTDKKGDYYLQIKVLLDSSYDHYHRQVYTVQNWLIDISGISRAIMITGLFASHYISSNIFKTALIENLFMGSNY